MTRDFEVIDQGSIVAITPMNEAAQQWLDDNVEAEGWQFLGHSLCVDHRCADAIIEGIICDGLSV